ncbi:MAG TPA: pyridoxamine 5'-phosphate oxidase family protein, partial [Tenericutes bacterium]|nr:pyridoxamine 5'-phosphate oxidase family protein [Mycoplasmatota bacterium]
EIIKIVTEIIDEKNIALIGTKSNRGYPNIKALSVMKKEGLHKFYFSTKINSTKVKQIKRRKKGCIYFYDEKNYIGIMIEGTFEVEHNRSVGISKLYDLDAIDPYDFCTIIFTSKYLHAYLHYQKVKIKL